MSYKTEFFAAANTSEGFISCFGEIFDPKRLSTLYVIKGGPGTGKSTMMKKIASAAEEAGYGVEYYYCSSDSDSLDGVVIPSLSFGIMDGTSPHMTDPVYPGAVDTVFDIYPYFDTEKLKQNKAAIIALTDENKDLHRKSTVYRKFAGAAEKEAFECISSCVDMQKLSEAASRIASAAGGKSGEAMHRQISAFSAKGAVTLQTYENMAVSKTGVCDEYGSAYLFMNCLKEALIKRRVRFYYSVDTLLPDRCEAIFVADSGEYFCVTGKTADAKNGGYGKLINMKRFITPEKLKAARGKLRMCGKIKTTLENEAGRLITEAGRVHDELEEYYKQAVDFEGLRKKAELLADCIIKRKA